MGAFQKDVDKILNIIYNQCNKGGNNMDIQEFITAVVDKNENEMRGFLADELIVRWHNTNEQFTLEEYLKVNCSYPGNWLGEVKTIIPTSEGCVAVVQISSEDGSVKVHQISVIKITDEKIVALDEYYSEDGSIPQWRLDMNIGNLIIN